MVTSKYYEKMAKLIEELGQENSKLKAVVIDKDMEIGRLVAKLHNIEEGLKRLEAFMMDGPDRSIDPVNREGVAVFALVDGCGECEIHAPTLSLLIDEINNRR